MQICLQKSQVRIPRVEKLKRLCRKFIFLKGDLDSCDQKDFKNINITFVVDILSGRIQEFTVGTIDLLKTAFKWKPLKLFVFREGILNSEN